MMLYSRHLLLFLAIYVSSTLASVTSPLTAHQDQHEDDSSLTSAQHTRALLQATAPAFTIANIGQTTPLVSACNNIFVTLQLSRAVSAPCTFTITGLRGSTTPDTSQMMLNSTSACDSGHCHPFELEGKWTQSNGRLEITVQDTIETDTPYVFFFELQNPNVEQESSPVTISQAVCGGNTFSERRMRTQNARLMAVPGGTNPLKTVKTQFVDVSMSQKNPLALASNELDISIKLNTFLPEMSKLEIDNVQCIEPLEIDDSIYWEECPCITTSSSTTSEPPTTTSSSTTSTPAPTTSSSSTTAPATSSTTTTAAPTTSSTTTLAPTTSSTTTTPVATSSSSTTAAPTSSSTTTSVAPTSSSSTTSVAPTSSSSTTSVAPTSSSSTTSVAPTSSSSTTSVAPTSSSSTTSVAPTSSSSTTTALTTFTTTQGAITTPVNTTTSESVTTTWWTETSASFSTTTRSSTTTTPVRTSSSTTAVPTSSSSTTSAAPTSSSTTTSLAPTTSSSTTTSLAPTTSSSTTTSLAPTTSSSTTTSLAPTTSSSTTTSLAPTTSSTTANAGNTTTAGSTSTTSVAPTTSSTTTSVAPTSSSTTPAPTTTSSSTTATPAPTTSSSTTTAAGTTSTTTTSVAPTTSTSTAAPTTTSSTTPAGSTSTTSVAPTTSSTTTSVAPTSSSTTPAPTTTSSSTTTTPAPTTTSSSTTTTPAPTTSSSTTTTVAPTTSSSTTTTTVAPTTSSSTTTTAAPTTSSSTTTTPAPTTSTPIFTSPAPPFVCRPCGYEPIVVHTSPPYALLHGGFYSSQHRRLLLFNSYDLDTTSWLGPLRANIKVRNQDCNQQGPALRIRGLVDSRDDGEHGEEECAVPIDQVGISLPNSDRLGVSNGANPFRVVPAAMTAFAVTQQNPYYDGETPSVAFGFTANSDLSPGSVILVSGMNHLNRSDTDAQTGIADVIISAPPTVFNPVAVWTEVDKSIRFVVRSTISQGQAQTLRVPGFVRTADIQRSYSSTAVLSGTVESGTYDAPFQESRGPVSVDLRQASPVRNVRAAQSGQGAIVVSWDRPVSSGPNNVDSELTGFDLTVLTSITPLARNSGSAWALSAEVVNGVDGVSDNAFRILTGRRVTFSVEAKNAFGNSGAASRNYVVGSIPCLTSCGDGRQDSGEQCDDGNSVSGDGCDSVCRVESNYVCFSDPVEWPCPTSTAGLSSCVVPQFEYIVVGDSTDLPSTSNEITVGFQANARIQAGSVLRLSGLTGSTQPSNSTFPIEALGGSALAQNAEWTQSTGELQLRTTAMIGAGEPLSLRFSLSNPSAAQAARAVTIMCSSCNYTGGALLGSAVSAQTVLGVVIIPPTCTAPLFGPGCAASCTGGIVRGDKCVCPPGRFGYTCSQVGVLSRQDSVPPTFVAPGAAVNLLSESGAGLKIPRGALREGAVISASTYDVLVDVSEDEKSELKSVSKVMDCRPDLVFAEDVELSIPMDLTTAAVEQSRGRRVLLSFFNTTTARWQIQGGYVDRVTGHTRVNTPHLSTWTAMSVVPSAVPNTVPPVPPVVPGGQGSTTTPRPTLTAPEDDKDGIWGTDLSDGEFVAATMGFVVLLCCVCSTCCLAIYCLTRPPRTKLPEPQRPPPDFTVGSPTAVFVDTPPPSQQWVSIPPGATVLPLSSPPAPRLISPESIGVSRI